jgi:type VI secretion system FHA domain protein
MGLHLKVVSRHRQSLGERGSKEFGQNGGTIGRSLESDWVLPDGQRFLSSRHASIDYRSGSYYIIDTSTNGVYINDAEQPVGRGNPQRIFSGDKIRIGDYEIVVSIDEIDSTREQMADAFHVDPVDLRQRVEAPDPTGCDLVDAHEITGVGIEMLLDEDEAATLSPLSYKFKADELRLEDDTPVRKQVEKAKIKPKAPTPSAPVRSDAAWTAPRARGAGSTERANGAAAERAPEAQAAKPSRHQGSVPAGRKTPPARQAAAAKPILGSQPKGTGSAQLALDAFFRGAGLEPRRLENQDAEQTLHRLGQLVREMIVGITESLHLRATQKAALRQSNTTIQRRDNNVLKFSASVDEALENLLFRNSSDYLGAVESTREAFGDLKIHQQCLLKSIGGALASYIERLDPDLLESKFSNGKLGAFMGAANKIKYWDMYRDLYLVVGQAPAGELPQLFLDELSRAYEKETTRAEGAQQGPDQHSKAS